VNGYPRYVVKVYQDETVVMAMPLNLPTGARLQAIDVQSLWRDNDVAMRTDRLVPWQTVEAIAEFVRKLSPEYEAVADAILGGFVESKVTP
jgi:hypothetical protein